MNRATSMSSSSRGALPRAVKILEHAARPVTTVAAVVGAAAVVGLAVNVGLDVALRTLANQPVNGTIEFVTYWWMVPMVFFGFAVAQRAREHIDLPLVYERLTGVARPILGVITQAVTVVFAGLIGWFGIESAVHQASVGEYAGATGVIIWPVRFAVPLGILALLLELTISTLKEVDSGPASPDETSASQESA